jgi:hypothetical protein
MILTNRSVVPQGGPCSFRMRQYVPSALVVAVFALGSLDLAAQPDAPSAPIANNGAILWAAVRDIKSRNLYYGPGGKEHLPKGPMKFLREAMEGASPKFDVSDPSGDKWRVKLGIEAQPETVATRLLWAIGYITNENYFFSDLKVEGMPSHLRRGQNFVGPGGDVKSVRLQRHPGGEKKAATWSWRHNPFYRTREFNGLRIMMALISNWDLKDENNAVYDDKISPGHKLYEVSDLGASFGMNGKSYTDGLSKNNLKAYRHSKFISKVTPDCVDFNFPTHPPFLYLFNFPFFVSQLRMHWIGKHIPRADARWLGSLLAQLSQEQIRDAFRAANYSPAQVEAYAAAVQDRIAALEKL